MARLRKPPGPVGYLKKEARLAVKRMMPHRVAWRVLGPGTPFPSKRTIKRKFGTRTKQVNAQTRQADVQRANRQAAKKTAAKKTTAKRADPYAAALAIPGQNRAAAAKMAKAAQPQAGKKQVPIRGKRGRFDGSKVMTDTDRALYERARSGHVDPALLPRTPRRR